MPKEISALARRNKLPGSGTLAGPAGGSFTMLAVWNSETGSSAEGSEHEERATDAPQFPSRGAHCRCSDSSGPTCCSLSFNHQYLSGVVNSRSCEDCKNQQMI